MEDKEALKEMAVRFVELMKDGEAHGVLLDVVKGVDLYEAILGESEIKPKPKKKGGRPKGSGKKKALRGGNFWPSTSRNLDLCPHRRGATRH